MRSASSPTYLPLELSLVPFILTSIFETYGDDVFRCTRSGAVRFSLYIVRLRFPSILFFYAPKLFLPCFILHSLSLSRYMRKDLTRPPFPFCSNPACVRSRAVPRRAQRLPVIYLDLIRSIRSTLDALFPQGSALEASAGSFPSSSSGPANGNSDAGHATYPSASGTHNIGCF